MSEVNDIPQFCYWDRDLHPANHFHYSNLYCDKCFVNRITTVYHGELHLPAKGTWPLRVYKDPFTELPDRDASTLTYLYAATTCYPNRIYDNLNRGLTRYVNIRSYEMWTKEESTQYTYAWNQIHSDSPYLILFEVFKASTVHTSQPDDYEYSDDLPKNERETEYYYILRKVD